MMEVTLKKRHIAFAMSPIKNDDKASEIKLIKSLQDGLSDYTNPEQGITIEISGKRLFEIYSILSSSQEGLSASINKEIMDGDTNVPGLAGQVYIKAKMGDEEASQLLLKIQAWKENYNNRINETINENLEYLKNIDLTF